MVTKDKDNADKADKGLNSRGTRELYRHVGVGEANKYLRDSWNWKVDTSKSEEAFDERQSEVKSSARQCYPQ